MSQGKRMGSTIKGGMGDFTAARRLEPDYRPPNPFYVKVGQVFKKGKCHIKVLEKVQGYRWRVEAIKGPTKGKVGELEDWIIKDWELIS